MGVRVDKYLGYVVDIQKEWDKLLDEQQDYWSCSKEKESEIFKPYYTHGDFKGKITILYDGMSGEYTKLIYILDYCTDTSDDDESIVKTVSKQLENVEVPNEIRQKLREVYKEIFGIEYVTEFKVQMEYLIHWS